MSVLGEELEDLVDLVFETTREHLVGFVETKELDVIGAKSAAIYHIIHAAGGADDDVHALLEFRHVFADVGTAYACVTFNVNVVAECNDDLLYLLRKLPGWGKNECLSSFDTKVDLLENGNGEGGGFASARLGLCDDIMTLHHRDDSTLLDGGRSLETGVLSKRGDGEWKKYRPICVDPTKELWPQIHVIEAVHTECVRVPSAH